MPTDPTTPERLAEIRSKPLGDLTPHDRLYWLTVDPNSYWETCHRAARQDAEREVAAELQDARRQAAAGDRQRLLAPVRAVTRVIRRSRG